MQEIKNWTKIWNVERVFYKLTNEISLPRPVTQTFMTWFVVGFFVSLKMKGIFPFSFESDMVNHLGVPFGIAFIMNKRTFQGKRPYNYLFSALLFLFRPKTSRRAKRIGRTRKQSLDINILSHERSELIE